MLLSKPAKRLKIETDLSERCIRVFSDCDGIGCVVQVFKRSGLCFKLSGKSESDPLANLVFEHNYMHLPQVKGAVCYEDMCKRSLAELPCADFYSVGFPCQKFSLQGKGEGPVEVILEMQANIIAYIELKRPRMFFIENVPQWLYKWGDNVLEVLGALLAIMDASGKPVYQIRCHILNSKKVSGIPQNRLRFYMVGFKIAAQVVPFSFPIEVPTKSLEVIYDDPVQGGI